jgi:SAM-dependent methyltransferase
MLRSAARGRAYTHEETDLNRPSEAGALDVAAERHAASHAGAERTSRDLARFLPKLRCPTCGGALACGPDALRCAASHRWALPIPEQAHAPTPSTGARLGERIFDHPHLYRAKVALLNTLNPMPLAEVDRWTAGREVIDLGSGSFQALYAPRQAALRVGLDHSHNAAATADRLYPESLHLVAGLEQPLPFADKSFDVALLLFVLHHLPPALAPRVLAEARRVAREQVLVFDHTRSDVAWQRRVQLAYWATFDGGDIYRSQAEWDTLLAHEQVLEARRFGRMFRNVCYYRIAA